MSHCAWFFGLALHSVLPLTAAADRGSPVAIGVVDSPPMAFVRPDGSPAGFFVDVFEEAARRAGLKIVWRVTQGSAEESLRSGQVDLWSAGFATPERKRALFVSPPWWSLEAWILARSTGPLRSLQDIRGKRIAYLGQPSREYLARTYLAGADLRVFASDDLAAMSFCQGLADGLFSDFLAVQRFVFHRPPGCESASLVPIPVPEATMPLSILALRGHEEPARLLSHEIREMALQGWLTDRALHYPPISPSPASLFSDLAVFRRSEHELIGGLIALSFMLGLSAVFIARLRRDIKERRQAEKALRASEAVLLEAQRMGKIGVWTWDSSTGLVTGSPQAFRNLGLDYEQRGLTIQQGLDRIHPGDREAVFAAVGRCMQTGQPADLDFRAVLPSGLERVLEARIERVGTSGGTVQIRAVERDVTEQRRNEEIFLEIARGIAGVTGAEFFASLAARLARSLDADVAFVGQTVSSQNGRVRSLAVSLAGQPASPLEFDLENTPAASLAASGPCIVRDSVRERFPLDPLLALWQAESYAAIPLKDSRGEMLGLLAVVRKSPVEDPLLIRSVLEIFAVRATAELDRLRAEQALRESEARYRTYVHAGPFALLVADSTGRFVDANDEACRLTGYSREELVRMNVGGLAAPGYSGEAIRSFAEMVSRGRVSSEHWILRKDGRRRLCAIEGVRLSADLLLGFCQDITDRVRAASEERARLERVRRRHEVLFRLATSHGEGGDLRRAAAQITAAVGGVVDAARVSVWLDDGNRGLLCADLYEPATGLHSAGLAISRERCGLYLSSLETSRALDVPYVLHDARTAELAHYCAGLGICSILDAPVWIAGRLSGSVRFERTGDSSPWARDDVAFAAEVADRVGETISNDARRRAESALRDSEERYRRLFESAGDAIVLLHDGVHVDCNAKAAELYGCTREEIIGKHAMRFAPLFQPDGADSWEFALARAADVAARGVSQYEWRACRFNGAPLDVDVTLNRLEIAGVPHLLALVKDITERKRSHELLHLQGEALEQSVDGIAVLSLEGRICFCNRSFALLHGYDREEMIGKAASVFKPGRSEAEMAAWILEVCRSGRKEEVGLLLRRDGESFLARVTDSVLADESGRTVGLIKVVRDVTEAARMEEQLRHAQKMEAIGRLAGGVSHDFNNILTVIRGHADLLLQDLDGHGGPLKEGLEEIQKASLRASELTQQLLAFSRKQIVQPAAIDLNTLIEDLAAMLRRLIGEGIEMATSFEPSLWLVLADKGQMHQVVMNLVVNARDATSGRGCIELRTANVRIRECSPAGLLPGDYVCLSVSDNGVGMDSKTRERIFEPFFTTKPDGAGTGLGLATIYGIVQQCGGSIDVETEPGRGATFHVFLPRTLAAAAGAADPSLPAATGSETILLVEDQDDVRAFVSRLLRRSGYRVIEAATGPQAIELARGISVDLMLSDVMMPEMTGPDLAQRLRQSHPGVPAIFMSGYNEDDIIRSGAILKNAADYLQKPFSPDVLRAKIRSVLDARNPGHVAV